MKKQRTGTLNLWGTQAEDRTPLSLQGTLSEVRAPQSAGDPSRAQASGSWGCMPGLVLHSTPSCSATAPTAEWPAPCLWRGCGHTRLVNHLPGFRTLEILEKSSHTTAVISKAPADSTWRRSLGPLATPWDLQPAGNPQPLQAKASALLGP